MTKKLLIDIIANDKTKKALTGVQKNLGNVKRSVFSLKGALVGLGAGAVVKSFVNVGKEVESLQVRFKFLFGSIEEGKEAFDSLTDFAGRVPFSLEEISRASGNLAVVAKDAQDLNRVLEITGNVAAVTGLDFETTSSQIQRAFAGGIGAADLFRERGVRALLGFQNGAKVTAEETVARFEELFAGDGQFANATKDLATTLEGTISMIGDKYFKFQKDVASGFFDELKGEFGDLNVFLEQNEQQIKDIATAIGENFAGAISKTSNLIKNVAPAVKNVSDALGTTITGFQSLPSFVQTSGLISALLLGKKGVAAVTTISFLVGQIRELFNQASSLAQLEANIVNIQELEDAEFLLKSLNTRFGEIVQSQREMNEANFQLSIKELEELQRTIDKTKERIELLTSVDGFNKISVSTKHLSHNFKELTKEQKNNSSIFRQQSLELEKFRLKYRNVIDDTEELNSMSLENFRFELDKFNEKFRNNTDEQLSSLQRFKSGFQDAMNESTFDSFEKAGKTAFASLTKTLSDFVITGKLDMKGFGDAVKRALVEALIGEAVTAAIGKAKSLFQMKAIKTALINTYEAGTKALAQGGVLGPFLAAGVIATGIGMVNKIKGFEKGGRPPVGRPSMVGEAGPELFIPQQAGTIVPNNKLGGMGATTVNLNVYANDTEGFDDLLLKRRSTIVNVINDALNSQGKEALV
jgi:lambda family phage tail tape measure protein